MYRLSTQWLVLGNPLRRCMSWVTAESRGSAWRGGGGNCTVVDRSISGRPWPQGWGTSVVSLNVLRFFRPSTAKSNQFRIFPILTIKKTTLGKHGELGEPNPTPQVKCGGRRKLKAQGLNKLHVGSAKGLGPLCAPPMLTVTWTNITWTRTTPPDCGNFMLIWLIIFWITATGKKRMTIWKKNTSNMTLLQMWWVRWKIKWGVCLFRLPVNGWGSPIDIIHRCGTFCHLFSAFFPFSLWAHKHMYMRAQTHAWTRAHTDIATYLHTCLPDSQICKTRRNETRTERCKTLQ